ncbi:reverse transcriptase domain-containing protein [Tanacetum coccineum]
MSLEMPSKASRALDNAQDEGANTEVKGRLEAGSLPTKRRVYGKQCGDGKIPYQSKRTRSSFKKNSIENIPQNKNQKASVLSKLASVAFNHLTKEVLVEVLNTRMHVGAQSVMERIMRQGYYWPTMHQDAKEEVDKCDSCQIHAPVPRLSKTRLTSIMSPWPFYEWGLDILGPLPEGPDKLKFIIVAIDYFTKWMEAKPLAKTIVEDQVDEHCSSTPTSQRPGRKSQQVPNAWSQSKIG